tara:strand:- start:390 stop:1289 length:900 start_codon:yes stop_codon:yes gene_type:complete
MKIIFILTFLVCFSGISYSADFYSHWGDGRAEISSYNIDMRRYNQMRNGNSVLIFVTEDINKETFIKVESPVSKDDRMYVMKLNQIIRFNTGIYDYSVMSSIFSEVDGGNWPFSLRKVTNSIQDWCGHIFDEVMVGSNYVEGRINSYFERDGVSFYTLPVSSNFVSGDGLLIRMRELNGEWLKPGQQIAISFFPSLWGIQLRSLERKISDAILTKTIGKDLEISSQIVPVYEWQLDFENNWEKYWIEQEYPHRILAWEFSDGGRGRLIETLRLSYWELNNNEHLKYRKFLDLNSRKSVN